MDREPINRLPLLLRRLAGYLADGLLLFALVVISQAVLVASGVHPFVRGDASLDPAPDPALLHLWVTACTTLPFAIYFAAGFASARGATLGQRLVGIRVEAADGLPPSPGRAMVRAAVLLVPFELNHTVMFHAAPGDGGSAALYAAGGGAVAALCAVYLSLPLLRADGRSVHDLAAGTRVARARRR